MYFEVLIIISMVPSLLSLVVMPALDSSATNDKLDDSKVVLCV